MSNSRRTRSKKIKTEELATMESDSEDEAVDTKVNGEMEYCRNPMHEIWFKSSHMLPLADFYPGRKQCRKCVLKKTSMRREHIRQQSKGSTKMNSLDLLFKNSTIAPPQIPKVVTAKNSPCKVKVVPTKVIPAPVKDNSNSPILQFLREMKLEKYFVNFEKEEIYLIEDLTYLQENDLEKIVVPIGPRAKIRERINQLKQLPPFSYNFIK